MKKLRKTGGIPTLPPHTRRIGSFFSLLGEVGTDDGRGVVLPPPRVCGLTEELPDQTYTAGRVVDAKRGEVFKSCYSCWSLLWC